MTGKPVFETTQAFPTLRITTGFSDYHCFNANAVRGSAHPYQCVFFECLHALKKAFSARTVEQKSIGHYTASTAVNRIVSTGDFKKNNA
jgi:hypothetical protein